MTKEEFVEWRHALKLSQADAAATLGVTLGCVGHWEAGRRKVPKPIAILCKLIKTIHFK